MIEPLKKILLLLISSVLLLFACSKNFSDNPQPNQPPKTFISIFSDNELSPVTSRQTLHWWGDDPDGIVVGFIYTFDENAPNLQSWDFNSPDPNWHFDATQTEETFSLTLTGADTIYSFWVKAIDDDAAADPDGAMQRFPIVNTRPTVEFPVGTDVPEETFTVATFTWSASDLDGNDTIARFQYVLDDTTNDDAWVDIPANSSSITLTFDDGLTDGEHVFYLRAVDLATATSDIIRMPRDDTGVWVVREPVSNFLVVDDYNIADAADDFYQSTLQGLVGTIDVWDIKSNGGALEPTSSTAFTQTLLLFDRIFWYADTGPNLEKAQVGIPDFLAAGGKIMMTTSFREFSSNQGDPLDFSPVDSLGTKINRILRDQIVQPASEFAALGYSDMKVNTAIIPNIFPLVPKISSRVFYVLPESANWPGTPAIGVINASDTFVFFGVPLASLNGLETSSQVIEKVINEIFQ